MDKRALNKLRLVIETLASDERDKHMNAAEMRVFLLAALQPGISQLQIAESIEISQSEVSRIMVKFQAIDGKGHGLLKAEPDAQYRKRNLVSLTPRGQRLAERITELLN